MQILKILNNTGKILLQELEVAYQFSHPIFLCIWHNTFLNPLREEDFPNTKKRARRRWGLDSACSSLGEEGGGFCLQVREGEGGKESPAAPTDQHLRERRPSWAHEQTRWLGTGWGESSLASGSSSVQKGSCSHHHTRWLQGLDDLLKTKAGRWGWVLFPFPLKYLNILIKELTNKAWVKREEDFDRIPWHGIFGDMIGSKLLITATTKTLTCAKNMFHVSQLAETLQQPSEVSLSVWRLQRSNWGPGSSGSLLTVTQTGGSRAGIRSQAGWLRAQALKQRRVFWKTSRAMTHNTKCKRKTRGRRGN